MRKIVIAPDKFKGSLNGFQFCEAVSKGIKAIIPNIEIINIPLADGGDGTVEVIQHYIKGTMQSTMVKDPILRNVKANYLFALKSQTAYIEMAQASGLNLLADSEQNPLLSSSFGTGELIIEAINKGAKHIILGLGGSATNDGGMGMARALGYHFFDVNRKELSGIGSDLIRLHSIDSSNVDRRLTNTMFSLACDVTNPLYGPNGAAYIYAPQKGSSASDVELLNKGLINFNSIIKKQFRLDLQRIKGSGAAGGLGGGCIAFLNAKMHAGIQLIMQMAQFTSKIHNADWIISGEGIIDNQTLEGKVIKGIINVMDSQKLAVFCGKNKLLKKDAHPISYISETMSLAKNKGDSIINSAKYVELLARQFAKDNLV